MRNHNNEYERIEFNNKSFITQDRSISEEHTVVIDINNVSQNAISTGFMYRTSRFIDLIIKSHSIIKYI